MRIKALFFVPFVLVLAISFAYSGLFRTFYQQDEWMAQGHYFTEGIKAFFSFYTPLGFIGGGGRLLSQPILYFLYNFFPFRIEVFSVFAIIFHILNSYLLFKIVQKISKNNILALISSLFFATATVSSQAVSWIGASLNTLPSALFVFLSLFLYLTFLDNNKKKFFYFSIISALASYFFKESSVFIFVLLPLTHLIFGRRRVKILDLVKIYWVILAYGVLAILTRTLDLFLNFKGTASFVVENTHPWQRILIHIFIYPLESFSQTFIHPGVMWNLSDLFLKINYPRFDSQLTPVLRETLAADVVSIMLSLIFIFVFLFIYIKRKEFRKLIIFGLLFNLLSFLPFVLIDKGNAYLDSRYFYLGVAGGGILFAIFIDYLRSLLGKISKKNLSIGFILVLTLLFYIYQIKTIKADIRFQEDLSAQRLKFLYDLNTFVPKLPEKSIIYITGDTSFYTPVNKTPLQEGPGFTFMVWYYKKGNIPPNLINKNFLWDINSQGYEENSARGFGYFYDLSKLRIAVRSKHLDKNKVFGFYYKGREMKLINITDEVRKEI